MKSTLNRDYNQMHIPTQVDNAKLNEFFDNIDNLNLSQIDLINGKYNLYTRDLNNNTILHRVINNSLNEKHLIKTIKLLPELAKLINFTDNEGRTPLHLLFINQYYETYNLIEGILDNNKNKNDEIDNHIIDNVKEVKKYANELLKVGGEDKIIINYYVLDKYKKLPSNYLCQGINLTKLNKTINDLKIYNIENKNYNDTKPPKRPDDYNDNIDILSNNYLRDIYLFIRLLITEELDKNVRYKFKVNDYVDTYKRTFTILNNDYIEYYRNNNFYDKISRLMIDPKILNAPMYQHSTINGKTEDDYNKKIINNLIISDCNNYWYLRTNYIFDKMIKYNNIEIDNKLDEETKKILELLYKLKIQSVEDKSNSNILCKNFSDLLNKIISENYYLPFLLFIKNHRNHLKILFNLMKTIKKHKNVIDLLIDDRYNSRDINDINRQKDYIIDKINDYLHANVIIPKDQSKITDFLNISNDDNIIYLFLTILNNVLSDKNEHFTNFYNNFTRLILNKVNSPLKKLKDNIDNKKDELLGLDEYIELYVFDNNNMLTIYNKINV